MEAPRLGGFLRSSDLSAYHNPELQHASASNPLAMRAVRAGSLLGPRPPSLAAGPVGVSKNFNLIKPL